MRKRDATMKKKDAMMKKRDATKKNEVVAKKSEVVTNKIDAILSSYTIYDICLFISYVKHDLVAVLIILATYYR